MTKKREINVGIIGFGFMGKTHTYGYKTIPLFYENVPFQINLVAVCTRRPEQAEKARQELGFQWATTDPEKVFADPKIDVVNICTPNHLHKEMVIKALQAGKHVYCEKPLAISYQQAQEILTVYEKSQVKGQMVHQTRFFPAIMRAKQLISEGRLGQVLSFRAAYLHSGSVDPMKPIGWKQNKTVCGGGVLFDLGSHLLDLIYYLLGEYRAVLADTQTIYPTRPTPDGGRTGDLGEDRATLLVAMQDGSQGVLEASKIATGTNDELRLEIHGVDGALRFNLMDPNWLEFWDNRKKEVPLGGERGFTRLECVQRYPSPGGAFPSPKASIGWLRGHVHCLYSFLAGVVEGKEVQPSLADGAYIQYVMDQAYRSAAERRWIQL